MPRKRRGVTVSNKVKTGPKAKPHTASGRGVTVGGAVPYGAPARRHRPKGKGVTVGRRRKRG